MRYEKMTDGSVKLATDIYAHRTARGWVVVTAMGAGQYAASDPSGGRMYGSEKRCVAWSSRYGYVYASLAKAVAEEVLW